MRANKYNKAKDRSLIRSDMRQKKKFNRNREKKGIVPVGARKEAAYDIKP